MKNFCLLIVLLLSFSFATAQSTESKEKAVVQLDSNKEHTSIIAEPSTDKEVLVRTSDIKTFFNRERKEKNITLLFPQINRIRKA